MATTIDKTKCYQSIGVVSRLTGIPPQTIRDMEGRQLLPPIARLAGTGYRLYDEEAVEAIRAAHDRSQQRRGLAAS